MCYRAHILPVAIHRPRRVNVQADCPSCLKHPSVQPALSGPLRNSGQLLLNRYVSWQPDASAVAVYAFMLPLKGENPYCFPQSLAFPNCFGNCFVNR